MERLADSSVVSRPEPRPLQGSALRLRDPLVESARQKLVAGDHLIYPVEGDADIRQAPDESFLICAAESVKRATNRTFYWVISASRGGTSSCGAMRRISRAVTGAAFMDAVRCPLLSSEAFGSNSKTNVR